MNADIATTRNPYYDLGSYAPTLQQIPQNQTIASDRTKQPMANTPDANFIIRNEESLAHQPKETFGCSKLIKYERDVDLILAQMEKKTKEIAPKIIQSRLEKEKNKLPTSNQHLGISKTAHQHFYGKIHNPQENHATCEHCHEKEHDFCIISTSESNCLVEKFQTAYQRVAAEYNKRSESSKDKTKYKLSKEDGMVAAAIIKKNGKIVAQYITTSGGANEKIKNVFKLMQNESKAKIFDYEHHPETEKNIDRQGSLYAIFTKNSLDINQGKFLNFYGEEIKTIGSLVVDTEEARNRRHPSVNSQYTNFTVCAAQKVFQQIAKDFGQEIKLNPKSFSISMSEAWFKSSGEYRYNDAKRNKEWSTMHPVPSCDTCSFVLPKSLCKNSDQ